jgi:ribosome-binding protein aMBF1 (putative translation factor)
MVKLISADEIHKEWMKDPEFRAEYDALEEEFALVNALIDARIHANLTQAQLADRMETTQAVIARMEGGKVMPTTRTLKKLAAATGTWLRIKFEPLPAGEVKKAH